jgi:hypothetical protein
VTRLARGAAIVAAASLVIVGIALARSSGASARHATPASSPDPIPKATAPAPPAPVMDVPTLPRPSLATLDAGSMPWGDTSALVAAEQLRLDVCDCEDLACVAAANKRYARALGEIDPRTANPASKAEMHAANQCVARLLAAAGDAGR